MIGIREITRAIETDSICKIETYSPLKVSGIYTGDKILFSKLCRKVGIDSLDKGVEAECIIIESIIGIENFKVLFKFINVWNKREMEIE